jgi:hypothetical protein
MDIQLSIPQAEYVYSSAKSVAAVAGFGSGKTDAALIRASTTMLQYPGANIAYLAPTLQLIKDIWYPKVTEYFEELGIKCKINKAENIVSVGGFGKMFCRSMDSPEKIVGWEVLDAFLDEIDILNSKKANEVWIKTKARCRQKIDANEFTDPRLISEYGHKLSQMFVSTTPEGFKFTYDKFKNPKLKLPGAHLIQMSTYSNYKNLPADYIDDLRLNYPSELIDAYIEGIFCNLTSGRVWYKYDRDKNRAYDTVMKNEPLYVGMDFNIRRGCAVIHVKRNRYISAIDEIIDTYDTPETLSILKERYSDHPILVFPDASGSKGTSTKGNVSDHALIKEAGMRLIVNPANPLVKDRVAATNRLFCDDYGDRRYYVNPDTCPYYSTALEQQIYDPNGKPEKGKGKGDDVTDAGSYPISFLYPIKPMSSVQVSRAVM